ncbi:MAG: hypothetical protein HONBIEJF_00919 [Fimbriimonadaceae bacterium]|nr:hypothetical protein [Fimbriimonadaceae bacterium]
MISKKSVRTFTNLLYSIGMRTSKPKTDRSALVKSMSGVGSVYVAKELDDYLDTHTNLEPEQVQQVVGVLIDRMPELAQQVLDGSLTDILDQLDNSVCGANKSCDPHYCSGDDGDSCNVEGCRGQTCDTNECNDIHHCNGYNTSDANLIDQSQLFETEEWMTVRQEVLEALQQTVPVAPVDIRIRMRKQ